MMHKLLPAIMVALAATLLAACSSVNVVSDGGERAYRLRVRTGSFTAMGIIEQASKGLMIADLVALIASLDVVAPEIDR